MLPDSFGPLLLAILSLFAITFAKRRKYKLPPGPSGWPIIGNLYDVPHQSPWLRYLEMSRRYESDIIYLRVLNSHLVVLNSTKSIEQLLNKRSNIYSDRYVTPMLEMTALSRLISEMKYGDVWRVHRRAFHQHFNENAVDRYRAQISRYPRMLLKFLLDAPRDFLGLSRWFSGALILNVVYGFDIRDRRSPHLLAAEQSLAAVSAVGHAGSFLVDALPVLRHLPSWAPGAGFKRQAAEWRKGVAAMFEGPLHNVQREMASGKANPSVAATLLNKFDAGDDKEEHEFRVQRVAGTAFAGGHDTSASTMQTFFLAMLMNPDVQKAAQKELDRVVGPDRFPELDDKDSIPLITAILYECLRWHPVVPTGVPHRVMVDDVYEGYHIPAGSIIIGNPWSILHDESTYPNPDKFDPYRFLTPEGTLNKNVPPPDAGFGFGRRICPGRHFALRSLWMAVAHVLAVFDIEKPVDADGNVVEPSGEYSNSFIAGPLPFEADVKPRSDAAAELIRAVALAEG